MVTDYSLAIASHHHGFIGVQNSKSNKASANEARLLSNSLFVVSRGGTVFPQTHPEALTIATTKRMTKPASSELEGAKPVSKRLNGSPRRPKERSRVKRLQVARPNSYLVPRLHKSVKKRRRVDRDLSQSQKLISERFKAREPLATEHEQEGERKHLNFRSHRLRGIFLRSELWQLRRTSGPLRPKRPLRIRALQPCKSSSGN